MTATTTTAAPRFIPAQGLTHLSGATKVEAFWVNGAGWKVQARRDGLTIISQLHQHEHQAVEAYNRLVAEHTPVVVPVSTAPTLTPAAKGTQTKVSDPAHTALAVAALNGAVQRGGQPGQASIKLINSLAKRGYVTRTVVMDGLRKIVTGAVITPAGQRRLAELTKADRDTAARAARIAAALAIGTTPTAQLVNA